MPNHRLTQLATVVAALGATVFLVLLQFDFFRSHHQWSIATGDTSGVYHAFGESLIDALNADSNLAPFEKFSTEPSHGSAENLKKLRSGEVDFAFAQSDGDFGEDARLLASLYHEVLHVLVREESRIESIAQLRSRPVFMGVEGSGTRSLAQKALDHFGVEVLPQDQDKAESDQRISDRLVNQFKRMSIDAAFVLTAPGSLTMRLLLNQSEVKLKLISFGMDADDPAPTEGISLLSQGISPFQIPSYLYGSKPKKMVPTLAVEALLVVSADVNKSVVRGVSGSLFENRNKIARALGRSVQLDDSEEFESIFLPLHRGAKAYYSREQPSFIVEYAEVISLIITLLVGLWSIGALFLRWRAGLRKERIDVYYAELRKSAKLADEPRLKELYRIHEQAFSDLMRERLSADSSFIIFQDYLLSEIRRSERSIDSDSFPPAA